MPDTLPIRFVAARQRQAAKLPMDKLKIRGGAPLRGEVRVAGAKNAALPIVAASLLTDDELIVTNVPELADISTMVRLLRGMGVTHAGDNFQNSGHHHLLIDVDEPLNPDEPIPQDKAHMHFGAGQTEARIELPPGKHTLQLVLGDADHYPFVPPVVSKKITIRIK